MQEKVQNVAEEGASLIDEKVLSVPTYTCHRNDFNRSEKFLNSGFSEETTLLQAFPCDERSGVDELKTKRYKLKTFEMP